MADVNMARGFGSSGRSVRRKAISDTFAMQLLPEPQTNYFNKRRCKTIRNNRAIPNEAFRALHIIRPPAKSNWIAAEINCVRRALPRESTSASYDSG